MQEELPSKLARLFLGASSREHVVFLAPGSTRFEAMAAVLLLHQRWSYLRISRYVLGLVTMWNGFRHGKKLDLFGDYCEKSLKGPSFSSGALPFREYAPNVAVSHRAELLRLRVRKP